MIRAIHGARSSTSGSPRAPRSPSPRARRTLEALEEIFLREGFRRISVGEIAARLHCSRRTLYELAAAKEDLFLLVLDTFLRRIRRLGDEAALGAADLAGRIERYLAPGIRETARASNVFFADVAGLPPARRLFDAHQQARIAGLRAMVAEGARRGVFRGFDPHLVAEVFIGAYRRVSQPDFLAAANLSITEAYAELSRLLRHGLLHPENGKAGAARRSRARRSSQSRSRAHR
ncbi:MAG: TetR/AcrR family transcriptional regulator [Deltaproteobacteria bacterium]|nr:TetR/AcrR family transcriptional regulator [Deltaproteobacteria bacterium]